jgi:DNA-directed RNA polymerase specialized sigma24 family protein
VTQGEGTGECLSISELTAAYEELSPVKYAKLVRTAERLADGTEFGADDLIGEAIVRALDGTRNCPRNVDPMAFLWNAMKSIASDSRRSRKALPPPESIDEPAFAGAAAVVATRGRNAEEALMVAEDCARRLAALTELFKDRPDALCVVMGDCDGLPAEEIKIVCDLDQTALATARRYIRRTIDRAYPKGWRL